MAIAIALLLLVAGSVLFRLVSPWWSMPLASNWQQMDDTLHITVVVTAVFFVAINLFIVYTLWRYRHREGRRAAYEPENPRLERWLIGITTLGIAGLLAPGLAVYARYLSPPGDALVLEVLGQQWQWRYRFPGPDGRLGGSDVRFVAAGNPMGLDPADLRGQDDIVVAGNEVHLPQGRPVRVVLRSNDVLHDFFVPPLRSRMNIVPGQVSTFWFTPTLAGRYEAMCAQLCGIGHPRMQGLVVVEGEAAFRAWLAAQPGFATTLAAPAVGARAGQPQGGGLAADLVAQGRALAQSKGCAACHTVDGSVGVGPTWKGLFGKTETMTDGSRALVDDAYLRAFVRDPKARSVRGFAPVMPQIDVTDAELDALVAYIKSHGGGPAAPVRQ